MPDLPLRDIGSKPIPGPRLNWIGNTEIINTHFDNFIVAIAIKSRPLGEARLQLLELETNLRSRRLKSYN